MKLNYFGLVAAVLAFVSLALSWFTVTATSLDGSITMSYTAYLYMVQGTVNGMSASVFPYVWFVLAALALILITAVACLAGSFLAGRRGKLLLLAAGILALLALVVFGAGLFNSDFANPALEPQTIMNLFPKGSFGQITADIAAQNDYNLGWDMSYGFWLAIGSAIFAFVAAVAPSLMAKKAAAPAKVAKT